jgi:hypothetical protein
VITSFEGERVSKELAEMHGVHIASFAGGIERGPCVQIVVTDDRDANRRPGPPLRVYADYGIVQLTRVQAEFVRDVLTKWLTPEGK